MASSNHDDLFKIREAEQKEAEHWWRELEHNPTRKRIDEWEHYQVRAIFHKQCVRACESLVQLYYSDKLPTALAAIRKRDTLEELVRYAATSLEHRRPDRLQHLPPTTLRLFTPEEIAAAFLAHVDIGHDEFERERKLVVVTAKCYRNIGVVQDFFPTPHEACYELITYSQARNNPDYTLLEPSAGMGDLAEVMRYEYPDAKLLVVEQQWTMREMLELKGFNLVGDDFLEFCQPVDHIIMNPPFSNANDAKHIRHAYEILNVGGSIAALASPSMAFNTKGAYNGFTDWWQSVGGRREPLRRGIFKGKGINIDPQLLWLEEKQDIAPEPVVEEPKPKRKRKA